MKRKKKRVVQITQGRVPLMYCPKCHAKHDGMTGVGSTLDARAEAGSLIICFDCAAVNRLELGCLVAVSPEEMAEMYENGNVDALKLFDAALKLARANCAKKALGGRIKP